MTSINLSAIENLVEAARLPAIHCGPFLVVHELPSQAEEPNGQSVAYSRQGTALGKGTYGEVHLETAMNESHNVPAVRAVKEISKKFCTLHEIEWWRELEAMIMLSHHKVRAILAYCGTPLILSRIKDPSPHSMGGTRTQKLSFSPWSTSSTGIYLNIYVLSKKKMRSKKLRDSWRRA